MAVQIFEFRFHTKGRSFGWYIQFVFVLFEADGRNSKIKCEWFYEYVFHHKCYGFSKMCWTIRNDLGKTQVRHLPFLVTVSRVVAYVQRQLNSFYNTIGYVSKIAIFNTSVNAWEVAIQAKVYDNCVTQFRECRWKNWVCLSRKLFLFGSQVTRNRWVSENIQLLNNSFL